jgi:hypothetical protein
MYPNATFYDRICDQIMTGINLFTHIMFMSDKEAMIQYTLTWSLAYSWRGGIGEPVAKPAGKSLS